MISFGKRKKLKDSDYDQEFRSVKVTDYVREKIDLYTKKAIELSGSNIECGGYLVAPRDATDGVAYEAILWNQKVTGTRCTSNNFWQPTNDYKLLGWWHSHANMSTFHSGQDDRHFKSVISDIRKDPNYGLDTPSREYLGVFDKDIASYNLEDGIISLDVGNEVYKIELEGLIGDTKLKRVVKKSKNLTPLAYSLVVNTHGDNYCELAYDNKNEVVYKKRVPLDIVKDARDRSNLESEVEADVKENIFVNHKHKWIKDLVIEKARLAEKYGTQSLEKEVKTEEQEPEYQSPSLEEEIVEEQSEKAVEEISDLVDDYKIKSPPGGAAEVVRASWSSYSKGMDYFMDLDLDDEIRSLATILKGDYKEDGKRYWKWEDRLEKFKEEYSKLDYDKLVWNKERLIDLYCVVNANSYVKKKHSKKFNYIKKCLCHKEMPKYVKFKKLAKAFFKKGGKKNE